MDFDFETEAFLYESRTMYGNPSRLAINSRPFRTYRPVLMSKRVERFSVTVFLVVFEAYIFHNSESGVYKSSLMYAKQDTNIYFTSCNIYAIHTFDKKNCNNL